MITFARSAPGEPGGAPGEDVEVRARVERLALRVDAEDRLPPLEVGSVDDDLPVEPARAQERGVQDVGSVRRGHQDHRGPLVETVHLDQELVQGLLPLVVSAAEPRAAVAADGVDLVDEHDRRRARLRLLEEVADPSGADADEHLDEVGAADREERDAGLARDGAREERLARPGRTEQQHTARDLRAHRLELGRMLEVLLDLLQLLDRLVHAGDVLEGGLRLVLADGLVPAPAELHHAPAAALRSVHHPEEEAGEQEDREDVVQEPDELVRLLRAWPRSERRLLGARS